MSKNSKIVVAVAVVAALAGVGHAGYAFLQNKAPTSPKAEDTVKVETQGAYALGSYFGESIANVVEQQQKLGIKLDTQQVLNGLRDRLAGNAKFDNEGLQVAMLAIESEVRTKTTEKLEAEKSESAQKGQAYRESFASEEGVKLTESGLMYKIENAGEGKVVNTSDLVTVNYRGTLVDGTEFDSSYKRNMPVSFALDKVIPGWTEGLQLIKKGGKIKLVVPAELAYNDAQIPGIPAGSTLVFDVELLGVGEADAKNLKEAAEKALAEKAQAEAETETTEEVKADVVESEAVAAE